MPFQFNVAYRGNITSKELNDKIHLLLGKNAILYGFQISATGTDNTISISPGCAIIQGCVIKEGTETHALTIPINANPDTIKYVIYLEYIRGVNGVSDQGLIKYATDSESLGDHVAILGYVNRPQNVSNITSEHITIIPPELNSIAELENTLNTMNSKSTTGITTGTSLVYNYSAEGFNLADGSILHLKLHTANEKGATLNVNGTGAKPIIDTAGKPIIKGFAENSYVTLVYNGTNYVVQGGGSGSGQGGYTVAAEDLGGTGVVTGTVSGKSVQVVSSIDSEVVVATTDIEDLQYGYYSIMLRIHLSDITSTANLIRIRTYHVIDTTETLLNTAYIKPSDLSAAGWEVFGYVTDFTGTSAGNSPKLRIRVDCVANPVSQTIDLDYIRVAATYTSIMSLPWT